MVHKKFCIDGEGIVRQNYANLQTKWQSLSERHTK